MKETDDTPLPENESEDTLEDILRVIAANATYALLRMDDIALQIAHLQVEVADLHHRRRVSRQQATDQDPEWH